VSCCQGLDAGGAGRDSLFKAPGWTGWGERGGWPALSTDRFWVWGASSFAPFAKGGPVHPSQTPTSIPNYDRRMPTGLKRYYGSGDLHLITCSCYQRRPLLGTPHRRDLFLDILEAGGPPFPQVPFGLGVPVLRAFCEGRAYPPGHRLEPPIRTMIRIPQIQFSPAVFTRNPLFVST
jgi:hypothetical protein